MKRATTRSYAFVVAIALTTSASITVPAQAASESPAALPNATADRVLGQADFSSIGIGSTGDKFNVPAGIAIVPNDVPLSASPGRMFVADFNNSRVLSWPNAASFTSGQKADLVLGQPGVDVVNDPLPLTAQRLYGPESLVVDAAGNLYVADTLGHRILLFRPPFSTYMSAERVFGQGFWGNNFAGKDPNSPTLSATSLNFPRGVAVDASNSLYVADDYNNRVLIFYSPADMNNISAAVTADVVIGQANMSSNGAGGGQSGMESPKGVAVDGSGNLYVASWADNRVLMYRPFLADGAAAYRVFGQGGTGTSFTSNAAGTSATAMNHPIDLAVDGAGNLYVSDQHNNRVLVFNAPTDANPTSAVTADFVYGQGSAGDNFNVANTGPVSASQFYRASEGTLGIAVSSYGTVYVAEFDANRVLAFDAPQVNKVVGSGTPESCTEGELQSKMAGGGTITFNCGGAVTINFLNTKVIGVPGIPLMPLTIDGRNQITLSGLNSTRLFLVQRGEELILKNISLIKGSVNHSGAAVLNYGTLTLQNAILRDHSAQGVWAGGAIANVVGRLTIENSVLEDSIAADGGAIYNDGIFSLKNTILRNNVARNGNGGAIFIIGEFQSVISASLFINNRAISEAGTNRGGGAIYVNGKRPDSETLFVLNSQFQANNAVAGGAIYVDGINGAALSRVTLVNTTFLGNSADNGGGIFSRSATTKINNTTFSENSAANGGAVYNFDSNTTISFTTFSGNSATGGGGGIFQVAVRRLTFNNIVIAHGNGGGNCFVAEIDAHTITPGGFNVSDDNSCTAHFFSQTSDKNNTDPKLGPLADNGGPTLTHMPLPGSPLIDGGQCGAGPSLDQRGAARPAGVSCDIGAVEYAATGSRVYVPVAMR